MSLQIGIAISSIVLAAATLCARQYKRYKPELHYLTRLVKRRIVAQKKEQDQDNENIEITALTVRYDHAWHTLDRETHQFMYDSPTHTFRTLALKITGRSDVDAIHVNYMFDSTPYSIIYESQYHSIVEFPIYTVNAPTAMSPRSPANIIKVTHRLVWALALGDNNQYEDVTRILRGFAGPHGNFYTDTRYKVKFAHILQQCKPNIQKSCKIIICRDLFNNYYLYTVSQPQMNMVWPLDRHVRKIPTEYVPLKLRQL
jgi:hypothetical protein